MELQIGRVNVSVTCDMDVIFKFKYNPGSIYGCIILAFIVRIGNIACI